MSEITLRTDIDADRTKVYEALNTHDGLTGWWTTGVNREGEVLLFDFPEIPEPFRLRRDRADKEEIVWTAIGAFPPHWSGTVITWQLTDTPDGTGTRVDFRHAGFAADDPDLPHTDDTWSRLMTRLKQYAETGTAQPFFTL
ncbi:SRPBCC domain-containing protein [Streptomyces sp. RLB3-17]|uniref:SRPBCC family protein n=1 Tax=unclassified Streptomyces TaxID=2593676 RepID=UPI001164F56D|nr:MULTISPECIES: SRPBCC domain-containing protein [unclassified Streptomyces]QDO01707.1 SRPBCC domain-containing protein [Streptomyces sp. RLB1-9]QDO23439.1 SRPBCC domain-containing protein [Streptomyces sp. S1A1-8]QDO33565.1 SRPBCC domain-containing protein [Streptomyces sp. S1A1-3]QDO43515.1 SRPBCC domain-containing protein [Streptomyces sp. RLB3-17]